MKKIWLAGWWLAQVFALGMACADDDDMPAPPPPQPAQAAVVVAPLHRQWLNRDALAYGQVVSDVRRSLNLSVPRAVRVMSVRVLPGDAVVKGQALLTLVNAPDAEQSMQKAREALAYARREQVRIAGLVKARLATAAQLSAANKALADAKAAWQAQQATGADHTVTVLRAPANGYVVAVNVAVGDRPAAGITLLQLASSRAQEALLAVEATDALRLKLGAAVQLVSVLRPEVKAEGRVVRVASALVNGSLAVRVNVPTGQFLPGEQVSASVTLARLFGDVVPRSAVLPDDNGFHVYQVRAGHAVLVPVKISLERGNLTLVEGALSTDLPVVTLGNYELQPGMAVRETQPAPPDMRGGL